MRIGVLTSSRAEFGIYLPLLKRLNADSFFNVEVIAFGTHLSHFHGYTLNQILEENLSVPHKIESLVLGDTTEAMSSSMGLTTLKFASFWAKHQDHFDLVFCVGDRFEMHSAVISAIPYGIKFAHFHGGETTLGAVDNIFRHAISLSSYLHFVSTEAYAKRLFHLLGEKDRIYSVGALSLDNITSMELYSIEEFFDKWNIDLRKPSVLVTLHPETVGVDKNAEYAKILAVAINQMATYQVIITMPNPDPSASLVRSVWENELERNDRVTLIENFGTKGYFTCMSHCTFLLGNTSSGIIEAASFNKYVINLGTRQQGRVRSANVFDSEFDVSSILNKVKDISKLPPYKGGNVYWSGGAVQKVIKVLKTIDL